MYSMVVVSPRFLEKLSPMDRGTAGLGHGSSKVTRSRNGKNQDGVHCYGSMGSVSCRQAITLSQTLITLS